MAGDESFGRVQSAYERLRRKQPHLSHKELWHQAERAVMSGTDSPGEALSLQATQDRIATRTEELVATEGSGGSPADPTVRDAARKGIAAFLVRAREQGMIDRRTFEDLKDLLDEIYEVPTAEPPAPPEPVPPKPVPAEAAPPTPVPAEVAPPKPVPPEPAPPKPARPPAVETPRPALPSWRPPAKKPPVRPRTHPVRPADTAKPVTATPVRPPTPRPDPVPPTRQRGAELAGAVRSRAESLWEVIGPDFSVHGFSYLGLLITFVGVFGFMLFSFKDLEDSYKPIVEILIPVIFFGWAYYLKRRGALVVAHLMGFLGGLLLPLVVYAGMVDSAPVTPDLSGGWLIVGLVVTSLLIAGAYAWWSGRHADSWLRFLVAPMVWMAALAPGFAFKTDEALTGDAITRLVSASPAFSAVAIAATLLLFVKRPDHRLAAPSFAAAIPAVPITYLLTVALAAGEGWAYPAPLILAGAASLVSVEVLARRYGYASEVALVRPLVLAVTLAPLIPSWGIAWTGMIVVVAYLAMVEWEIRGVGDPVALGLAGAGVAGGLAMTVAEPWLMVVGWAIATVWAHLRRVTGIEADERGLVTMTAAALLPLGLSLGLVVALPDGAAFAVIGTLLVVVTAAVRWSKTDDAFWAYWLTAAGSVLGVATAARYLDAGSGSWSWAAVTAMVFAAVTVGAAPDWPAARVWMASAAAIGALAVGLDAAAVTNQAVWWATAGLITVAVATLWSHPVAANLASVGHLVALGALFAGGSSAARAIALGAWSAGWLIAVVGDWYERPPARVLIERTGSEQGWLDEEFRRVIEAAPSVILAISIPLTVVYAAGLWDRFAENPSWTGATLALLAIGYAVVAARVERRPVSTVFAVGAVLLSLAGIAASIPAPWPSIVASTAVIVVSWLVARPRHVTLYVWFAWGMSFVLGVLLAERGGVPVRYLHAVVLLLGAAFVVGGLLADDVREGRRRLGDGLRTGWLRYPVVLGALAIPIGLAPAYTQEPHVFAVWSLAAAIGYGVVAIQLRVGMVTAPAYALAALGVAILSPWPVNERPLVLVFIAGLLVAASMASNRLQSGTLESRLRWDLPPLILAHGIAFAALARAVTTESIATWIAVGALSVIVGVWKQQRAWVDIGNVLVLVAAAAAGQGWMTGALAVTALRGVVSVRVYPAERVSHHALGVVATAATWVSFALWQEWSAADAAAYTALAFGALALVVGGLVRWRRLAPDWASAWGGLALVGSIAAVAGAVPDNVADPLPAIGTGMFALGAALASRSVGSPALRWLTVVSAGVAWIEIGLWQGWSVSHEVSYTALVFGGLGAVVGAWIAFGDLSRDWGIAWGGLAAVGVGAALVATVVPGNVDDGLPAAGAVLFAVGVVLAAREISNPALKVLAAAMVGVAWVELGLWQEWSSSEAVSYTALAFGGLGALVGAWIAFGDLSRDWAVAWGGLSAVGLGAALAMTVVPGNVDDALPAVGAALFGVGLALTSRRVGHVSLKWLTTAMAGVAWVELSLWLEWSPAQATSYTALAFGALGAVVGAWIFLRKMPSEWAVAWGGLSAAGVGVSLAAIVVPGNVGDPLPAMGAALFAVGVALTTREYPHLALKWLTTAMAGVVWVELALWLEWSVTEAASYTAIAFGGLAAFVGLWIASRNLTRDWAVAWGGLAFAGWAASVAAVPFDNVDLLLALGSMLFATGAGLASRRFSHPAMVALTVVASGIAWIELVAGAGWAVEQAVSYTSLMAGLVALSAALAVRFVRLTRSWTIGWGGLAVAMTAAAWAGGLPAQPLAITAIAPAAGLAMMAVAAQLAARPLDYPLHFAAVGLTGWSWVALAFGLDWTRETSVVNTAIGFALLAVGVAEIARRAMWTDGNAQPLNAARAWFGLGVAGVAGAGALVMTIDQRLPAWLAVAIGLGLLASALARAASPLSWPPIRELSVFVLVGAIIILGYALEAPPSAMAVATILLGVAGTAASLGLTMRRPGSPWRNPLVMLGAAATMTALLHAVVSLPARGPLTVVLLGVAAQLVAAGIIFERPILLSLGPPIVLAAWLGVAVEAMQGTALWFTIPIALTLIAEIDIVRWNRRRSEQPVATRELLALEFAAIGLLGAVVIVEMFGTSAAYALVGFILAGGLLLWAVVTRVRRRVVAAGVMATVTAVLSIFAAAASQAPPSAFFWIAAAGTGFSVMLTMALIEAYRSKTGPVMLRFDQLMEGWE